MYWPGPVLRRPAQLIGGNVNSLESSVQRVIGLDAHPDTFTAAILRGPTPAAAITEKTFHRVPWNRLQSWLERHCGQADVFALEAIGRSGPTLVDQGLQNRQPSAARSDPTEWIERQSAASKNKGIAAGRPGLRAGSGPEISARERLKP
jgi:hypothetical protein